MRLTQGPKENRFRPAIDPLFRSAALAFGPRVVGVLVSGGMDDGVSGLGAIQDAGGIAVVQEVGDAAVSTLPFNALARLKVDFCLRAAEIGPLLSRLSQGEEPDAPRARKRSPMTRKEMELEVRQATASNELDSEFITLGEPSLLTCPECHGTLLRMKDERILRFRCHTGHAFTADSLLDALTEGVEEALWNAVRAIEESAMLLNHMAGHKPAQEGASATDFRQAAEAALARAKAVRTVIADNEDAREQVSRSATETAQSANGSRRTPSH
jgi:two-component system chemotaxis response regulator CheB